MLTVIIDTPFNSRKILKIICVTWFITKIICYKLWFADRLFPLVPVHEMLSSLPPLLHSIFFISSLACMVILPFFPNKKVAAILLLLELLSCSLDQNRWQPWEYQFIFMLAGYVFIKDEKQIRFSWQLIMAGLFFFSGISKLNNAFIHDIWQHLMLRRWLGINTITPWLNRTGYMLPLIEMVAGIGLLIKMTRRIAVWVLCLMHLFILLMLGPFGLNINAVIWPWNLLMPLLLVSLFYNTAFALRYFRSPNFFSWLVLLCWWILPWLQLKGYWDKYLSSVLYSGGVEQLFICTDNPAAKKQMAPYFDSTFRIIPCSTSLSVYNWGIKEMKTAPYPEPRIYHAIIAAWKKKYPGTKDRFYLYKPGFAPKVEEVMEEE